MRLHLNTDAYDINSLAELSAHLDQLDTIEKLEAWIVSAEEPSLCLLKNHSAVLLMYLRYPGDVGFISMQGKAISGMTEFTMANGQVDELPLSWCIEKELACKAMIYFFMNSGARCPDVLWNVI